jgi:serine phosphatase RsbU (regulator of sigma subunit)
MAARTRGRRPSLSVPPGARRFFETYTRDVTAEDLQRLFTSDAREAYRFFARGIDEQAIGSLPWHRRPFVRLRLFFLAFTLKLSPARRILYAAALGAAVIGLAQLFRGFGTVDAPIAGVMVHVLVPVPVWRDGTLWLLAGFLLVNLLVFLEVADRLSLKNDLDIAREIQQAMLPRGTYRGGGIEAHGTTRPANTVGGDFFDILPLADGRVAVALGDVAGKGSPAALLMALLLAMLRTLIDEGLEDAELIQRLNVQIGRHAPPSRFITLFFAAYDPATGTLRYVNAGHLPGLIRRRSGTFERLATGGIALGMFEEATYRSGQVRLDPEDWLVLYSDGITEAENAAGRPFEESGLEELIRHHEADAPAELCTAALAAVARHSGDTRFADDLTVLAMRRVAASDV